MDVTSAAASIQNAQTKNNYAYQFTVAEAAVGSLTTGDKYKLQVWGDNGSTTSLLATLYFQQTSEESSAVADVTVPIDLASPPADIGALDGLMLTGGLDVAPARYGETPHPKVKRADAARDDFEITLVSEALARDLPVLAICRGHQVLNVALGGGLLQHIDGDGHRADYRSEGYPSRWHTVRLAPDIRPRALLGADEIEVRRAVGSVGRGGITICAVKAVQKQ